jgi:hypothetical protein
VEGKRATGTNWACRPCRAMLRTPSEGGAGMVSLQVFGFSPVMPILRVFGPFLTCKGLISRQLHRKRGLFKFERGVIKNKARTKSQSRQTDWTATSFMKPGIEDTERRYEETRNGFSTGLTELTELRKRRGLRAEGWIQTVTADIDGYRRLIIISIGALREGM